MGSGGLWARAWLVGAALTTLGPSIYVVSAAREAWPWTCAPMFAESHHDDTAFYEPRLVVERTGGKESPLGVRDTGVSGWHFSRLLLVKAYRTDDPTSPHGFLAHDSPALFEERLGRFLGATVDTSRKRKKSRLPRDAVAVRLELVPRIPPGPPHVVGRYDLATRRFTRAAP